MNGSRTFNRFLLSMVMASFVLPFATCSAWQEEPIVRELLVPYEELNVILEADPHRVFLDKDEYEALIEAAQEKPSELLPRDSVMTRSETRIEIIDSRATVEHLMSFEILEDSKWFLFSLEILNIGIREATLDGAAAPLVRGPDGRPSLLVKGKGVHEFVLRGTTLVSQSAAQQSFLLTLPRAAAHQATVIVSGNVELRSGAPVQSRTYDEATDRTTIELLPQQNTLNPTFSTNNKENSTDQQLLAQSVLVDEITQGYERLHATVSLYPLRGKISEVRFDLPPGFEVTRAEAPEVARWEVLSEAEGSTLLVSLNEELTRRVVLQLTLNRSANSAEQWLAELTTWKFPRFKPQATQSHVSLMGLWVEDRFVPSQSVQEGLLQVDSGVLQAVTPTSLIAAEPGAPLLRQTASFIAPDDSFDWTASIQLQESQLFSTLSTVVTVGDRAVQARGSVAVRSEGETRFEFPWSLPQGWQLQTLTDASGTPVQWERLGESEAGESLLKVRIPRGIKPGEPALLDFQMEGHPAGWLDQWSTQSLAIPDFRLGEGLIERGSIAIVAIDDLRVLPVSAEGMIPLVESEKGAIGWNFPTDLAFRYSGPSKLELEVTRKSPQLTASVYSMFQVTMGQVKCVSEIQYSIQETAARELKFSLPKEAPSEVSISGLDGLELREVTQSSQDDRTVWTIRLAAPVVDRARIRVEFAAPLGNTAAESWIVMLGRAEEVSLHTSTFTVDASPEFDVTVSTDARVVDEGEMAAADLGLGKRRVGTWQALGGTPTATIELAKRVGYGLPPAVVQSAHLVTQLSVNGRAQTRIEYQLATKVTLLEARLPQDSQLWGVLIDNRPIKPQREGDRLLLGLPTSDSNSPRTLVMVYETPINAINWSGQVELPSPAIFAVNSGGESELIPVAQLQWDVVPPPGFNVRQLGGEVQQEYRSRPITAPEQLAGVIAWLFQPIQVPQRLATFVSPMSQLAETASPMSNYSTKSYESAGAADAYPMAPAPMAPASEMDGVLAIPPGAPMSGPARELRDEAEQLSAAAESDAETPRSEAPSEPMGDLPSNEPAEGGESKEEAAGDRPEPVFVPDRMLGVGSLNISLVESIDAGDRVAFTALAENPRLSLSVYAYSQMEILGLFAGCASFLIGLVLRRKSRAWRVSWILMLIILGSIPAVITDAFDPWIPLFNGLFFAACLLVLVEACWSWLIVPTKALLIKGLNGCCRLVGCSCRIPTAVLLLPLITMLAWANTAESVSAQEPPTAVDVDAVLKWLEEFEGPVQVPADAVVIPFDPERPESMEEPSRILVPYAKYVELWNRAYPDQPLEPQGPMFKAMLVAAEYKAILDDQRELVVNGKLTIDLLDESVAVLPLPLAGATLTSATVDGRAARLQVFAHDQIRWDQMPQPNVGIPPATLMLSVEGKGRHEFEFEVRLEVTKQGGWSSTSAFLPPAIASKVLLTVPAAGTEIKQIGWIDRPDFQTTLPQEVVESALAESGQWEVRWRTGQVTTEVDRALTATSEALFDVRDDGARLTWRLNLAFPGTQRDSITLSVPQGWAVDSVTSEQLRGFTVRDEGDRQQVDVAMLQAVRDAVSIIVHLSRRESLVGESVDIDVPYVSVRDAALESGVLGVRRSPRMELKTQLDDGLSRDDFSDVYTGLAQITEGLDPTVLTPVPYQAFRFVKPPFTLRLQASPAKSNATAIWRAALRVDRREVAIDANLRVQPAGQPIYRVSIAWPKGYQLTRIAPESLEWSVTEDENLRTLTIDLLDGQVAPFEVSIFARTDRATDVMQGVGDRLELPVISMGGVSSWTGEWAVLADPDTDVQFQNLIGGRERQVTENQWLGAAQRALAKRLIEITSSQPYGADVVLIPRTPDVAGRSLTNVRVTPRRIETTTLFDFDIKQAGVSLLSVNLPESWRDARVSARLLRRQSIQPATQADGQPRAGWITMTFELQDAIRGNYSILMELDQSLELLNQPLLLPEIASGQTTRRLVAFENAGRDELVIDQQAIVGLTEVGRQQQVWREVTELLGDSISHLYQANADATQASVSLSLVERQAVERVGARIGLAVHTLVVDESGGYRAKVEYRVDNAEEAFLEIRLPEQASLWTCLVAGEGVKPIDAGTGDSRVVRIPLIRTELCEADYPVVILYGGRCEAPSRGSKVALPLVTDTSINVELSQLRLYLPENHQWYFDGSMKEVTDEREFAIGFQTYLSRRIQEAQRALENTNDFGLIRAANNLSQVRELYEQNVSSLSALSGESSRELRTAQAGNEALLKEAELQIQEELTDRQNLSVDNRDKLNSVYEGQQLQRSSNIVSDLGQNFSSPQPAQAAAQTAAEFNPNWYLNNSLTIQGQAQVELNRRGYSADAAPATRVYQGRGGADRQVDEDALRSQNYRTQNLFQNDPSQANRGLAPPQAAPSDVSNFERYSQQLDLTQQAPQAGQLGSGAGGFGGGGGQGPLGGGGPMSSSGPMPTGLSNATAGYGFVVEDYEDSGLVSLDLELPENGELFLFTTPRGELEVVARGVSDDWLGRMLLLAAVLVGLLVAGLIARSIVKKGSWSWPASVVGASTLMLIGLIVTFVVGPSLPSLGLVIFGIVRLILFVVRKRSTATASA